MYPIQIDFYKKKCVMIGAGKIARRRAEMLKEEGAEICVVSPEPCPSYFDDVSLYKRKKYDKSDIEGAFMVFAATDDVTLNQTIADDARKMGILVSSVNGGGDAVIPSVRKSDDFTVSVSTNGASPSLSSSLSDEIENILKECHGLCGIHKEIREKLDCLDSDERYAIMNKLSSKAMRNLYSVCGKDAFLKMASELCGGGIKKSKSDKAVLVVSFGTSYENTREKTIGAVENRIGDVFDGFDVFRAFTSGMIIRKMRKNGTYVDTVTEALARLYLMGYKEVYCQPTHIMPGEEYDDFIRDANAFSQVFTVFKTGRPLLSKTEDYPALIHALRDEISLPDDCAVVFMGHGTSHWANCVYPALQFWFSAEGFDNVFVGTVEGFPELDDLIKQLERKKYKTVYLLPLMLVAGDHAQNDMAGDDEDSWKSILEKLGYEVVPKLIGLGEYDGVRAMYAEHLNEIINDIQ